ncbi:MAG TPA: hypothetical protein VG796_05110 [Verrucomicrobiales bacterium]|nr:hypothetical protein [Verrucomicrobiales bacterium]
MTLRSLFARLLTILGPSLLLLLSGCSHPGELEVKKAVTVETATIAHGNFSNLDDIARFLAGMPGASNSPLLPVRQTEHWQRYSRNMDELWRRFAVMRQPRIASFSRSQLGGLRNPNTLWYPFSGPDVLFAEAFFPGSNNCLLSGLEGSEMLPDFHTLTPQEIDTALDGLYSSLTTSLNCSFFITADMRVDLQRTRLKGTLPIVLVFLARLGYDIHSIAPVSLDGAGNVVSGHPGGWPGYLVRAGGKNIYYFTGNVADFSLRSDNRYLNFVSRFGPVVTYLKSASYLMHTDEFQTIRSAILRQSTAILADDSGIPLSAFDNSWDLQFYGRYSGVLEIFKSYYQPKLAEIYAAGGGNVHHIDFGVGYKFEAGESALILARKR